jgi:inorganic pyrophosphatase
VSQRATPIPDYLEAVIEDPAGSTVRHVVDPVSGAWVTYRHPHARRPWPAAYGYLLGTYNASDGDALDVLVLSSQPLTTGQWVQVRPIGLFLRPDGDHKVLAVHCGDPHYGTVQDLTQVPPADLRAIEDWFAAWDTVLGWAAAEAAWTLIASAKESGRDS